MHSAPQGEASEGKVRGRAEGAGALGEDGGGETARLEEAADGDGGRADQSAGPSETERTGD